MSAWTLDDARRTYNIAHWSEGYFDVDGRGRLAVRPRGEDGPAIALPEVIERARGLGLQLPILVRFADILGDKLSRLQGAFGKVMSELDYSGGYTAVYPIKVNQQNSVAGELVARGTHGFGLEAGSKPELMAVLALSRGGIVVCNGYKDREYIRLALIGRKLGLDVFIVIEKASELPLVIEESRALGVTPLLGVRMRLATLGGGKWQNTGGDKAKFGLVPRQILDLCAELRAAGMEDSLKLLHFHMGSQISNVRDIAAGMKEAMRYFVELNAMGHAIRYVDVGGGLGVDYEGTRSRSYCSINYGLEQYASAVVEAIVRVCDEHALPHPHVMTESGRAMTAHHAVLVTNVTAVERSPDGAVPPMHENEPGVIRHLRQVHRELDLRSPLELYQEAQFHAGEGHAAYAQGEISLNQRAELDDLYYAIVHGVRARLRQDLRAHREIIDEINEKLADKYFTNFSVFQSVPDVWAIDQIFPILPIERLDESPTRRGVLEDLTCDSDGRIDLYVDSEGLDTSLPLHAMREGEEYRLGIFLVGAYQETLGDMHNLFGDTDSVDVRVSADGWELSQPRQGDTADKLLAYVGYEAGALRAAYRAKLHAAQLDPATRARLEADLESGLTGYTYLEE